MSSRIRWQQFPSAVSRYALIVLTLCFCFLALAGPSAAQSQVTSTPTGEIFTAPGTQTFSITVPSGVTLGSVSVLTLGALNLDFTEVAGGTTCPNVTAGTCTVEVQFQPTAPGRRQGCVDLNDPSGKTLLAISLDGSGTEALTAFTPSTISTVAGGGTGAVSGTATSARLMNPLGVAFDGSGNYYIADQKANQVYKVTAAGAISVFAGTGTAGYAGDGGAATSAELDGPSDVVVDGSGFVYISDTNNNVVRVVNTAGIISTYAGQYYKTGTTPPAVCATATNSVGDGCPGNQMILNTPVGLVFCHAQNLHIADKLNNRVRTINRVGYNTITQVGDGTAGYNGDGEGNTSAELNGPTGLDMDAGNYIYVADSGNHIIRKTKLTGTTPNPISTVAGTPGAAGSLGDGGLAISAQLNDPRGVRVDAAGDIFITDEATHVIREVNIATGNISTIAGNGTAGYTGDGGPAASAQLNGPTGMYVDQNGNVYVADSLNAVVRKIDLFDAPSVAFPATAMGATSAAQDVTVINSGASPLSISQITTPAGFSLGGTDTTCKSSDTLNPGQTCVLGVEFVPQTAGTTNGNLVLTDNSTPSTQTIQLTAATGTTTSGSGSYTLTAQTQTVSLAPGGMGTATLTLASTNFAGTVSFTTSVTSSNGTASNVTASASSVTLSTGGTTNATVTISANADAENRAPAPWGGGAAAFGMVLFGLPFVFRRRRAAGLLLAALAISVMGSLVACGGTSSPMKPDGQGARSYVVTVTPKATANAGGTVTDAAPVTITVSVQ
jgi:large repetitive protein